VPESDCGGSHIGINQTEKNDLDAAMLYVGAPALAGGILCMIAGALGAWGGFAAKKPALCCDAALAGIAGGILVLGALITLSVAVHFDAICDEFQCGSCPPLTTEFTSVAPNTMTYEQWAPNAMTYDQLAPVSVETSSLCCKDCEGLGTYSYSDGALSSRCSHLACKSEIDWVCDMKTKKTVSVVFSIIGAVIAITVSVLGCGAGCCCPNIFDELAAGDKQSGVQQAMQAIL